MWYESSTLTLDVFNSSTRPFFGTIFGEQHHDQPEKNWFWQEVVTITVVKPAVLISWFPFSWHSNIFQEILQVPVHVKFHKYLSSFWTSCRLILEYPATQINLDLSYHWKLCRWFKSSTKNSLTVGCPSLTEQLGSRLCISSPSGPLTGEYRWIFWSPDMDLVTSWNYSKTVKLFTLSPTPTHTMYVSLGGNIIELLKISFFDCLL